MLFSQIFPATGSQGTCLKFWYHMLGSQLGVMRIYYVLWTTGGMELLWEYGKDNGDVWNEGQTPVYSNDYYQVSLY